MTGSEISTIREAARLVDSSISPIPAGELRTAVRDVMAAIVRQHHHIPETSDQVAFCDCGDEWPCREVTAVHTLARVIIRMAEEATTTYLPSRGQR